MSYIGAISLNLSFYIYLIVYIPQVLHNKNIAHIKELSVWLHGLLFISCYADLIYGFSSGLPWQYKVVSIVCTVLVSIQHIQLTQYFSFVGYKRRWYAFILAFLVVIYINTK